MSSEFTLGLYLKPYVHRYLVNLYGDPVNLYCVEGLKLKNSLIGLLKSPSTRSEDRITLRYLTKETRIVISKTDFYKFGWEITKRDMISFNNEVEAIIKFFARSYIAFDKSFDIPISRSIRNFQEEYGFDEDIWSYDSIKKDFDRYGTFIKFDKVTVFKDNLKKIFIDQLSETGHRA